MHPEPEELLAWLDDELLADRTAEVSAHAESCPTCQAWIEESTRETARMTASLSLLDVPVPTVRVASLAARATARRARRRTWLAAASLFIGISAVATASPRSPVRAWLIAIVERLRDTPASDAPTVTTRDVTSAPPTPRLPEIAEDNAGVSLIPAESFLIEITDAQRSGELLVELHDAAALSVRAPSGTVSYVSSSTLLRVNNRRAISDITVLIPRSATRVEVRVGHRRVFLKDGQRIDTDAPATVPDAWRIPLRESSLR